MNPYSFNVLTEPWLPVVKMDGTRQELGILDCLEHAHEFKEIRVHAPIVEFGLYRLLTAFVLDTLIVFDCCPKVSLDLKQILREGRFDMEMIRKYADSCGDVFDLFHTDRPFLQTKMGDESLKALAGMFPAVPSGTNANLWHHKHEDDFSVSGPEAARLLTTIAPFMTSGGAGLSPSINGAPALYTLPAGDNIFETLVQNIPCRDQGQGNGKIAWRNDRCPGGERSQATLVETFTWRPRQIQLIPETDSDGMPIVRKMKFKKGDSTRMEWRDPNLAYRYDKDKVTPVRMRENRPIWRDAGPLLLLKGGTSGKDDSRVVFTRPDVVEQAFEIAQKGKDLTVQVYGMRTDMKMKIFEWIKSTLVVPANVGISTRLGFLVQSELNRADNAAFALRIAIKNLYPRGGEGNKNALSSLIDRSEKAYWQELEAVFYGLMSNFSSLDPDSAEDADSINSAASDWRRSIRRIALEQFEKAAKDMDADSDALARLVNSRTRLRGKIIAIIGEVV
jgi:CRISPR system Cascade subunit CasA